MTPQQEWVALTLTAIGTVTATLGFLRLARKEGREARKTAATLADEAKKAAEQAGQNAANLAAGHLNTLSQQLMAERTASEARFNRMQDRADRLNDKVERLEQEGHEREVKLVAAEREVAELRADLSLLYKYTVDLENTVRTAGVATPQRPDGLTILPPSRLTGAL